MNINFMLRLQIWYAEAQISLVLIDLCIINIDLHLDGRINFNILMQKFKIELEDIFAQIKENLIKLAVETNVNDDINEIACQFYAAFINKLNKSRKKIILFYN